MIQLFSGDETAALEWRVVDAPDEGHIARTFLQGERSLASLQQDAIMQVSISNFLEEAGEAPLLMSRADDGSIRIRGTDTADCLILTGKTAEVLRSYLDGEVVTVEDRMDMTMRRSRTKE